MKVNKNILVLIPMDKEQKLRLEKQAPDSNFIYCSPKEVNKEMVQRANIILGNPPAHMVKDSPNLELVQLNSAGAGVFVKEGVLPNGVVLTNATGAYGLAISEHMIGVLLTLYKKIYLYRNNQKKHMWKDEGEVKSIYGSSTLIVGAGDIGGEFAKKIKLLGSYTIGINRTGGEKPGYLDELYSLDKLDELLPKVDIVALSLPETKYTYKLFTRERIEKMKKDAVLINVGRGSVIDTEGLCDVMESGHLLGAALDVTDPEPLPDNHRIWDIDNAIITPHVSGDYHLRETLNRIVDFAIQNLGAFIREEELVNIVDFETGYRKSKKD